MLTIILGWVASTFPTLGKIFLDAYEAKLKAENNSESIQANLAAQKIQFDAQREAFEQQTLRAEDSRWGPWVRWGFAFPFVLFNAKAIIWDRMLHWGVTDQLSPELLQIESIIIGAYFGHSAIAIVGRALAKRN